MTHFNVQKVTIGPFLARIGWKYIQHDPWCLSDKIMTNLDVQVATVWPFLGDIGQKNVHDDPWSIRLHLDPFWTYKRRQLVSFLQRRDGNILNIIPDVGDTRGQFCISRCLSCLLHVLCTEICCSHEGVPQGLPMCYLLTKKVTLVCEVSHLCIGGGRINSENL